MVPLKPTIAVSWCCFSWGPKHLALAQANIEGHHHHKSQNGGPGGQFPVTARKEGKEDLNALWDTIQAESILCEVQFQQKVHHYD